MQNVTFAFLDPQEGHFLRVTNRQESTSERMFTLDDDFPIFETTDAKAIIDIRRCDGDNHSLEAKNGKLPNSSLINIDDFIPVAFVREMTPVVPGGEMFASSTVVRLVCFDETFNSDTYWLDDLENRHQIYVQQSLRSF